MNLPTTLTFIRLLMAPLFAFFFIVGYRNQLSLNWLWASVVVLSISELTDALDGHLARSRGEVTDFGKVFDPISDSLARLTAFISFCWVGIAPLWMFLIFMYRDSLMSLLRIICASRGLVLAARTSGKLKAIFQAVVIYVVVFLVLAQAYGLTILPSSVGGHHPGYWFIFAAAAVTALSLIDYVIPNWQKIRSMMRSDS